MPTAVVDGITTRYEVAGSGPALLLFSPGGFNATLENWTNFGIYKRLREAGVQRWWAVATGVVDRPPDQPKHRDHEAAGQRQQADQQGQQAPSEGQPHRLQPTPVAAVLGVAVTVREGLVEVALGEAVGTPVADGAFDEVMEAWVGGDVAAALPRSESALEIAARAQAVLDDLADRHRGETVLVVSHAAAIVATLAVLAFRPGRSSHLANGEHVVLERDVDGWRLG